MHGGSLWSAALPNFRPAKLTLSADVSTVFLPARIALVVFFDNSIVQERECSTSILKIIERSIVTASSTEVIKSELAARIVELLDRRGLTVRSAGLLAATAAADVSRIRQGRLDRFTVDRLIAILTRLDQSLEVSLQISDRPALPRKLNKRGER